jgi:hypothetical protein
MTNELEELRAFRAQVPAASAATWANARSALARAVLTELHLDTTIEDPERVVGVPLGAAGEPPGLPTRAPSLRRNAGAASVASGAFVAIVIAGAVLLAGPSGNSHSVPRTRASRSTLPRPAATLRLANYRFRLPVGFKEVDSPCAPTSRPTPGTPVTVLQHFTVAASAVGGCVEAELATGSATVPNGAKPIQVGGYQGFIASIAPTSETLYVAIATTDGNHYLVLSGSGLSPAKLITIATSGLPGTTGQTQPCTSNCG